MQPFRYKIPEPPRSPRRRRAPRRLMGGLALLGILGALWGGLPAIRAALSWGAGAHTADASELMRQGEGHMKRSRLREAVACFDQALKLGDARAYARSRDARFLLAATGTEISALPDHPAVWLARGDDELKHGRFTAALNAYTGAAKVAPGEVRPLIGRAEALKAAGRFEEAGKVYGEALRMAPENAAITEAWLEARHKAGDGRRALEEALEIYRAQARDSRNEAAQISLLDAYLREGSGGAALLTRYQSEVPGIDAVERQYFLAQAAMRHYRRNPHWHQDAFKRVEDACHKVLASKKGAYAPWRARTGRLLAEAYAARAQAWSERSDFEAAHSDLGRALALGRYLSRPEQAALHGQQARLLPLLGKPEAVASELEAALRLNPGSASRQELAAWHTQLGLGLLAAGRPKEAAILLKRALKATPDDAALLAHCHRALALAMVPAPLASCAATAGISTSEAQARLAEGLLALGRKAEAEQASIEAARGGVPSARFALVQAALAMDRGQHDQAGKVLEAAIKLGPTPALWAKLGGVDTALAASASEPARAPLWSKAREAYGQVLAVAPDDATRDRLLWLTKALADSASTHKKWAIAQRLSRQGLLLAPGDQALLRLNGEALAHATEADGQLGLESLAYSAIAACRGRFTLWFSPPSASVQ